MFFESPGPCAVCGAAHSGCKPDGDTSSEGVGVTRGLIVVRRNEPSRVVVPVVQPNTAAIAAPAAAWASSAEADEVRRRVREVTTPAPATSTAAPTAPTTTTTTRRRRG